MSWDGEEFWEQSLLDRHEDEVQERRERAYQKQLREEEDSCY
jgi:hypothetical protein